VGKVTVTITIGPEGLNVQGPQDQLQVLAILGLAEHAVKNGILGPKQEASPILLARGGLPPPNGSKGQ
jgi:hypothetical protein